MLAQTAPARCPRERPPANSEPSRALVHGKTDLAPTHYSVNVHVATLTNGLAAGTIIACGDLKAKSKKPHPAQAKGLQS